MFYFFINYKHAIFYKVSKQKFFTQRKFSVKIEYYFFIFSWFVFKEFFQSIYKSAQIYIDMRKTQSSSVDNIHFICFRFLEGFGRFTIIFLKPVFNGKYFIRFIFFHKIIGNGFRNSDNCCTLLGNSFFQFPEMF